MSETRQLILLLLALFAAVCSLSAALRAAEAATTSTYTLQIWREIADEVIAHRRAAA